MTDNKTGTDDIVMAIVSHPDDAEFLCAGTLALLGQKGWKIHMATMTAGDCGTRDLSPEEISAIRKAEAANAAEIIWAEYHCLECKDLFIQYDRPTLTKTIKLIRKVRPKIVLTMSPDCYMVDHEITSKLVRSACFGAGMVNIPTDDIQPYFHIPALYYLDPIEGKDKFGTEIRPGFVIDITSVIDIKEQMLSCHDSQRKWLLEHHKMDAYLDTMRKFSSIAGCYTDVKYGEGFRQHLGHAYPQENILLDVLKEFGSEVLEQNNS
jgi:LmbE family N-acetylglucosaminyl deacetylase